ncbi:DNA alkylation repair protein [Patescibacteria group bacterium]|nr:DNA alkylation repair protein [Patescibacteria group bacterium]MBU0776743.1 DNA alkylation repair protein [Patescibacteria group bacterium]MBU0846316.1 DNA alkylation repair protein [Patescibacteria group bacterium]MBU0922724.1 DNA alkylation repair protein [Patescibacteria group bacterium]MBU1066241.1 DNA alkylation repair protein [Patescibacteria group bacterium]
MEKIEEVLKKLKKLSNPKSIKGMARFGIRPDKALGISIPNLRELAKNIGKNHKLALQLWKSEIHEARILAGMIDEVDKVTQKQMDSWIKGFDSWDVCDQVCANLFDKTPYAFKKAIEWTKRKEEFEKRAGFALMACLAWHDKEANNNKFIKFFPSIKRESTDERNYVKKAVNWALRQIGKRNKNLNKEAIKIASVIQKRESKSARWIANDALRELRSDAVRKRLSTVRPAK